eukprot:m.39212 g.39212  ORF g.39212 m.39212 type:complete len:53 (+) comp12648_c0_seq1:93-251(+)
MFSADFALGVAVTAVATLAYTVYNALTFPKRTRESIPVEGNPSVGSALLFDM